MSSARLPSSSLTVISSSKSCHEKKIAVVKPFVEKSKSVVTLTSASAAKPAKSVWKNLIPVLLSAFCAAAIMYPLDLVRGLQMANAGSGIAMSTQQILSNFHKAHGIAGFFTQGLAPELVRSTWMRFIKFALFPVVHVAMTGLSEKEGTSMSKAWAAAVASIPEAISIMPLEVAKLALQLDNVNLYKNNMFSAMSRLYQERGWSIFTIGYIGVQFRQSLWSIGYFTTLSIFQKNIDQLVTLIGGGPDSELKKNETVKVFSTVLAGFLAGVFGGIINTPFDTIRSALQKRILTQASTSAVKHTFVGVGREFVTGKGIASMYSGFSFKAVHLGGGGALMAFFIPFFADMMDKFDKK